MATELQTTEAQAQAQAVRKAWIDQQVADFATDPSLRERAIASILYDSLMLAQTVAEMMQIVRGEGVGGLLKGAMGAIRNGK